MDNVLDGRFTGFISYGQSGSGKTHTMLGKEEPLHKNSSNKGLIQRTTTDLLKKINSMNVGYDIYASFFEIYIEQIRDLAKVYGDEQKKPNINNIESENLSLVDKEEKKASLGAKGAGLQIYNSNENDTEIKNLSKIRIKNEIDLNSMLKSCVSIFIQCNK